MHIQPIILLAFNDDFGGAKLRDISLEKKEINQALSDAEEHKLCKLVQIDAAEGKDIFDRFRMHRDQTRIFHFGGHADSFQLKTREATLDGKALADFLVHQKGLELVFLNACSTYEQASALVQNGITAVIATHEKIDDAWARKFASEFYKSLASGLEIKDAFEEAKTGVVSESGGGSRSMFWSDRVEGLENEYPWTLVLKEEDQPTWSLYTLRDIRLSLRWIEDVLDEFETLKEKYSYVPLSVTDTDFQWLKQWLREQKSSLEGQPQRSRLMKVKQELATKLEEIYTLQKANLSLIRELLNDEVEKLNYTNEKLFFNQYLRLYKEPVGIFVIHGLTNYGHKWLLNRLLLKRNGIKVKPIVVDRTISRRRQKNWLYIFLGDVASQIFKRDPNDLVLFEKFQQSQDIEEKVALITNRICTRLEEGETIIFRLNNFIYDILPPEKADVFLGDLVNSFWQKTYPRLKESAEYGNGRVMFFMLEKTEESILEDLSAYMELTPEASKNRKAPLVLDIQKINESDLQVWYTSQIMNVSNVKVQERLIHLSEPDQCKKLISEAKETHIGIFQQIYTCCETTFEEVDDF